MALAAGENRKTCELPFAGFQSVNKAHKCKNLYEQEEFVEIFAYFVSGSCKWRSRISVYAPLFAALLPRLAGFLATLPACQVF